MNDIRAILKLPRTQRARALAIMLSPYVDNEGAFTESPYNLLRAFGMPRAGSVKTSLELLKTEGWLRNDEARIGYRGEWKLDLNRLGKVTDVAREVEAVRLADELLTRYGPEGVKELVAVLQERLQDL